MVEKTRVANRIRQSTRRQSVADRRAIDSQQPLGHSLGLCLASPVMMRNEPFFDGDPAVDSTRRRLERLLNPPRRRTWTLALVGAASAWGLFRVGRALRSSARKNYAEVQTEGAGHRASNRLPAR